MNLKPMLRFLNIILAALLAGISAGILLGFNPLELSPGAYLDQQHNMLKALSVVMVALVVGTTIITLLSAFIQRSDKPTFYSLLAASVFFIACILITKMGNKPIDEMVITWNIGSLPDDWKMLRDEWWSFHKMRTMTELIALVLITWVSIRKD